MLVWYSCTLDQMSRMQEACLPRETLPSQNKCLAMPEQRASRNPMLP